MSHSPPSSAPRSRERTGESARAVEFLQQIFPTPRPIRIRLWDGTEMAGEDDPAITLVIRTPGSLRRMFRLPLEVHLGESYLRGDFDLEGDLWEIGPALAAVRTVAASPASLVSLARAWAALPRASAGEHADARAARLASPEYSREWDSEGIRYHYDAGNDFYALFLDSRMVYSCGYFSTPLDDLDTAQEAKLDLICRKLRLRPGERLLDIGCGWGALVIHAARNFGVRALGVTLSESQAELAKQRIHSAGLADRIQIELRDYRDLADESFDKVSSVGMFEHVGPDRLPEYFQRVRRLLKPGGLFLNHGIGNRPAPAQPPVKRLAHEATRRWLLGLGHFTRSYVFPSGGLVPVSRANLIAEAAGWEVRDVENLREHYGHTLRHWAERLERNRDAAIAAAGPRVFRIWRLYLGVASWQFASGELAVYQTLLEKPGNGPTQLPLTRDDLYA